MAYEIQPDYEAFLQGAYQLTNYDEVQDDNGFDRDSHRYEVVAGVSIDITNLLSGEFFAGFFTEDFDDSRFGSNDSYALGADFTWNVTPLTTVKLGASRRPEETTVDNASSVETTEVHLSADHELLRSLLLNAAASYQRDEFEGTSRDDDTIKVGVGATYLVNRYVHLNVSYNFTTRDSDAAGESYDRNAARIEVRFQY